MQREAEKTEYRSHDVTLAALEAKYTFYPDEVNYYNVHRPKSLIVALQRRIEKFDQAIVPKIFQDCMNERVTEQHVLTAAGTGHVITLVKTEAEREYALRTNMLLTIPEDYMELEFEFLKIFTKLGIPTTPLYYADISRKEYPFDFQIMGKLPGRDLGADWEGSHESYDEISRQQGRYFARLYQYQGKGWGRLKKDVSGELYGIRSSLVEHLTAYLDHDLEVIALYGVLTPDEIEKVRLFFDSSELKQLFADTTPHFLHNDPSDLNMRYSGNKLVSVFDWEHAVMFDPISELGIAPTWKSAFPKTEMLVNGFLEELGHRPDNLDEKVSVYFLRKMLDKVAFALKGERLSQRHLDLLREGLMRCRLLDGSPR